MSWIEALILGLVQGLTEFLPVSSSGHLEIGKAILNIQAKENLTFSVLVHGATVLSILVVFYRDLRDLLVRSFRFEYNESNSYLLKLLLSIVPVGIVGVFFRDQVESFFTGNLVLVGSMLLVTAGLLAVTHFIPAGVNPAGQGGIPPESPAGEQAGGPTEIPTGNRKASRYGSRKISYLDAVIIGTAQALAVMPGISRSGATISTALFLGNRRDEAARFSFLMVILPILAANLIDLIDMGSGGGISASGAAGGISAAVSGGGGSLSAGVDPGGLGSYGAGVCPDGGSIGWVPLITGFAAAFISGLLACRWMLSIVRKGKLLYFGIYCLIVGVIAIAVGLI
jgi:undecaprenyl-diphosphatase